MLLLPAKRKVSASPAIHPKMMIASSPQNTNIKTPTLSHQDEPTLPFYGTNSVQRSQMDGEALANALMLRSKTSIPGKSDLKLGQHSRFVCPLTP